MALWEGITEGLGESLVPNLLIGAAAIVLAPIVVPAVLAGMRPVAKTVVKGGVLVYDKARFMVAEVGEQMGDLVAEARAEMTASAAAMSSQGSPTESEGNLGDNAGIIWRHRTFRLYMPSQEASGSKSAK